MVVPKTSYEALRSKKDLVVVQIWLLLLGLHDTCMFRPVHSFSKEGVALMKNTLVGLLFLLTVHGEAQDWHLNTEPVYFFLKAPNVALDYAINSSLAVGVQYSALDWAKNGSTLNGIQVFYSRTGQINSSSEILKLYAGRLSPRTTLLKIESGEHPLPLFEILYGYRWVSNGGWTVAVLAGTFFTSQHVYPSISIPVGYMF
jgi:hypothetical protein